MKSKSAPTKNTTKKKPAKPTPAKTTKPAPRGPAATPAPTKKKPTKLAPVPTPAPAPPPTTAPVPRGALADEVPGTAIDGHRLSKCIRYAAAVTPKKDGVLVFTHDAKGRALVSGHDLRRSHTGYLLDDAAMRCDIAVPRADGIEFAGILDKLQGPLVRIDALGRATIRHGSGQPPMIFALGSAPITQTWKPPSQAGRASATGPLRIAASSQRAACAWASAIVYTHQTADGIEFNTITDEETGELLARAVLAEDGKDIYTEEERQAEIPGSRTAGDRAVQKAAEQLKQAVAENGATITVKVVESSPVVEGPKPDAKVEDAADEIRARLGDRPAPATDADAPAQGGAAEGASA